jgi:hypothetical protein
MKEPRTGRISVIHRVHSRLVHRQRQLKFASEATVLCSRLLYRLEITRFHGCVSVATACLWFCLYIVLEYRERAFMCIHITCFFQQLISHLGLKHCPKPRRHHQPQSDQTSSSGTWVKVPRSTDHERGTVLTHIQLREIHRYLKFYTP